MIPRPLCALVVALGAAVALEGCGSGPSTTATVTTSRTTGQSASPSAAPVTLQDFIPIAEKFVEEHRGLKFTAAVKITFLDDAAFLAKLNEQQNNSQNQADLAKAAKELRALALVQGNIDLSKLTTSLLNAAVVGFYSSKTKELFVRGVRPTPYTREVLVHELTHAVQDQHFGIYRPDLAKANDEQDTAFTSVYEGDAVRIEDEYRNSLSADERAQALQEGSSSSIPPDIPRILIELLQFPYVAGPSFDKTVLFLHGQAALDNAFRKPPTTTAQLLHPERYFSGDAGQPVDKPAADATSFDDGIFGEQGLDLLLERTVEAGRLSANDAQLASADWNGDRYVAWDQGSRSCVRVRFAVASSDAGNQLGDALRKYATTRSGVTVDGSGPITLTSCA